MDHFLCRQAEEISATSAPLLFLCADGILQLYLSEYEAVLNVNEKF